MQIQFFIDKQNPLCSFYKHINKIFKYKAETTQIRFKSPSVQSKALWREVSAYNKKNHLTKKEEICNAKREFLIY